MVRATGWLLVVVLAGPIPWPALASTADLPPLHPPREERHPFRPLREDREPVAQGRRGFVVGGLGLWSDPEILFEGVWSAGAGVLFPRESWWVVSRVDVEWVSEAYKSARLVRVGAGGRFPTGIGNKHDHVEAGIGVAHFERTHAPMGGSAPRPGSVESRVLPYLLLGFGFTSDPNVRPGFVVDTQGLIPGTRDAPRLLLLRIGIEF